MKKLVLFLMVTLFFAGIVACNGITTETTTTTDTTTQTTQSTTSESTTQTTTSESSTQSQTTSEVTDTYPVITGADDITIEKNSQFIPLQGVEAYDEEDGDLTSRITYSGNVNPMAVGVYTATYTVVDNDGNITTVNRTVTVVFTDTQGPLLVGVGDVTIYLGEEFDPLVGVSANDTVDGVVAVTYESNLDIWQVGTYQITYSAKDNSDNETTKVRNVTVTMGDFVFGEQTSYEMSALIFDQGVYSTPVFSGGVINDTIADFTYIKVEVITLAQTAGDITIALGDLVGSHQTLTLTTNHDVFEVYYVITQPLVDAVFTITGAMSFSDLEVRVQFAEIRDMVAPVLSVPTPEVAYALNYSLEGLEAILRNRVTAVDNIDGNITSTIEIDYQDLDLTTVGEYEVIYSVTDSGNNVTTYTRTVVIGNLIDSGFISDPNFANQGDGLWREKSNNGQATITYDEVEGTMIVTVTSLGDWLSAAGTYLKENSNGLEAGQWYMFTFTVKTTIDRTMGFRMGLATNEANGWVDDFDGRSDIRLSLNSEYQTFNFFFKLDSISSTAGYQEFLIEMNLGNLNYSNIGKDGVTTFKDVYMYKVATSFDPPTYTTHQAANLPVKFTEGDTEPNWLDYVTFYDMSKNVLVPTVNATAVNMSVAGTYDIIFSATDSNDLTTTYTLQIEVFTAANADVLGPVVTLKDGIPTTIDQFTNISVPLHQLVDAIDAVDGVIEVLPEMVDDGGLDFNVAGIYTVTYTVYDKSGNITEFDVEVTVTDKQGPVITIGDQTLNIFDAFDPLDLLVVEDNIDGIIDNSFVTITGLDQFLDQGIAVLAGSFEVTFEVSDSAGNLTSKTITVYVSDLLWDESSRTELGTPDEGPTHSTVNYDAVEEAYLITNINTATETWDRARWVYYFSNQELEQGQTYKFEIMVKATTATDLYFRIGANLYEEPWIDNFEGGLTSISITSEYALYQVIFTVDKDMPNGNAKFQFMYGYLSSDSTNTIYIKQFDLVKEAKPTYKNVFDLNTPDEVYHSNLVVNFEEEAMQIVNMVKLTNDWDPGRIVYYLDDTLFIKDMTYRIVFTVKADTATDLLLRIGSTLWEEPWIDNFEGGLQTISITEEYVTYEFLFVATKDIPNGNAKFQFMYGYLDTDNGNSIYIKDFRMEELVVPYEADALIVDDFNYADETAFEAEWTYRSSGTNYPTHDDMYLDIEEQLMVFTMPQTANNGWILARKYDSLSSLGVTDEYTKLAFYITNNTNATQIAVWLYWSGSQNSYLINLPATGESGWVVIDVFSASGKLPSEITDFGLGFNNWAGDNQVTGSFSISLIAAVKDVQELTYLVEEEVVIDDKVDYVLVDDFDYADETAFEAVWTERTNGTNYPISDKMNLVDGSMVFTLPQTANNGWILARRYETLLNLGGDNSTKYLAFLMTNNTNQTTASVWLYWSGNQNNYQITLPAPGTTGFAYINVTSSGKTVSEIIDFAFGFNNWAGDNQVNGSYEIHKIILVKDMMDLLKIKENIIVYNNFQRYIDDADYQAQTQDNIEGTRIGGGAFVKSNATLVIDGDNKYIIQNVSANSGTNGLKIRITKADIPSHINYIAIYIKATDTTNMVKFQSFIYTEAGAFNEITSSIIGDFQELVNGTYVYIPVSALKDDTVIISLVVNCSSGATGQLIFDNILLTKEFLVFENEAPVVSISQEDLALISGMTLIAGENIEAFLPTLLSMIDIVDAEDGIISPTAQMVDLGGLDLTNPVMGDYLLTIQTGDSLGLDSNLLTINIQILTMLEDFEGFADDTDFKANWSRIEAFRVSGGSWGLTAATLETVEDNKVLQFNYGPGTNGIKFDITKTELLALGAEYIGIFIETSLELTGSSRFQAFYYTSSGFTEITPYGQITYTDEGTYFFVKVSDLDENTIAISLMVNLASSNNGTMYLDNIVIK